MNKSGDVGMNSQNVFISINLNEPATNECILATDLLKNSLKSSTTAEEAFEEIIGEIMDKIAKV